MNVIGFLAGCVGVGCVAMAVVTANHDQRSKNR